MRRGTIIKRAAVAAAVAAGLLGAPATAPAGGIDPTRYCIQDRVNAYLYSNLYSVKGALALLDTTSDCGRYFVAHLADTQKRVAWQRCLEEGMRDSIPPLMWDPFIHAIDVCTSTWLEFRVQIDPEPR